MTAETYTANNREGQTWLILDEPLVIRGQFNKRENETLDEAMARHNEEKDILLTDHLPDGTKVSFGELFNLHWEAKYYESKNHDKSYWENCTNKPSFYKQKGMETRLVGSVKQKIKNMENQKVKTFEEFLIDNSETGVDFCLRVNRDDNGLVSFYIHPQDRDGETFDAYVSENRIIHKPSLDAIENAINPH